MNNINTSGAHCITGLRAGAFALALALLAVLLIRLGQVGQYIDVALQLGIGPFFAVAGYRKTFDPITVESVWGVLKKYKVPTWQCYLVTIGQGLGGLGLIAGSLSWWAALGLMPIMLGAFYLSSYPELKAAKPRGWMGWVIKGTNKESLLIVALASLLIRGWPF